MVKDTIIGKGLDTVVYSHEHNAVFSIKQSVDENTVASTPAESQDKDAQALINNVALWGTNNLLPNEWEEEIERNDTLRDAIEKEVERIYAGGIKIVYKDADTKELTEYDSEDVNAFMRHPRTQHAFKQNIRDYVVHRLPTSMLLISPDRSRASIHAKPTAHFRFEKQKKDGYIYQGYYSRNWNRNMAGDTDVLSFPIFDPLIDEVEHVKTQSVGAYFYKHAIVTHRTYYPVSPAYSAKLSGWLQTSNSLAIMFLYLQKNQMSPKYHIEVLQSYLREKYKERWDNADAAEINKIITEEMTHFQQMMHGVENTGNNLMTLKIILPPSNEEISAWDIKPFKGSTFENGYLDLSREADKHIQRAVGIDPTLQGANNSGMGSGSGSDKREAFNIRMSTASFHVSTILEPFYWVFQYNNWKGPKGEFLQLEMVVPVLQTLNQVTPSQRSTSNASTV